MRSEMRLLGPVRRRPLALRTGASGALVAFALSTSPGAITRAAPVAVGGAAHAAPARVQPRLDERGLDRATAALADAFEGRAFPGATYAFGVGGVVQRMGAVGALGWRGNSPAASPDSTRYDLASVTKAVATATAVLLLAEDGRIALDEPVQRHLPAFNGRFKHRVTWRHLLTHTSGLPEGARIRGSTPSERTARILRTRIDDPPGTHVQYTDVGFVVLWEAAERAAGEPLARYLERRVWRPLGMRHTGFLPGQECTACAPTLRLRDGTPYRGRPNDLLARRLGGVTGSAGLFSTASDLARFAAMVANDGELDGVRILSPASVALILTPAPGAGRRTLGWVALCAEEPDGDEPCERVAAVGHNGWTGTSLWIDPATRAWAVVLANRSFERRTPRDMQKVRRDVFLELRRTR